VGTEQIVLTEGPRVARTEGFAEVAFETDQPEGTLMSVRINGHDGTRLLAG
jgi:threonylcarbamoyladenosine tRNA methylthiotransferase MtaB